MYETYRIMSAKLDKNLQTKTMEELSAMYNGAEKQGNIKLRNSIYRVLYCKLYPMMLTIVKNYPMLSNDQRVEVTMMVLIATLRCYKDNMKTKFSTNYYNNLKNGMMTQINSLKCTKRCVWLNMVEDQELSSFVLGNQTNESYEEQRSSFVKNLDKATNLSTLEKRYINAVLSGVTKKEELIRLLQIRTDYNKFAKANPTKVLPKAKRRKKLFEVQQVETNLMTEDEELKMLKNIKKSIREKFNKFDRDLFYV